MEIQRQKAEGRRQKECRQSHAQFGVARDSLFVSRHSSFIVHRSSFPHGVTLLEVLVAIMVMTVGVLSVCALLPMGAYQAAQGRIADRSAAVGQSALRDFRIRGLAKVLNSDGTSPWANAGGGTPAALPVCFDPWLISRNLAAPGSFGGIPRITLTALPKPTIDNDPLKYLPADQIVVSSDDLTFDRPTEAEFRPTQVWTGSVKRQSTGDYSWMAILSQAPNDDPGIVPQKLVTLQIVVFNQRGSPAVEVGGNGNVDGFGGGTMSLPAGSGVRVGNWAYASGQRKWFRVSTIDEGGTSATLTGPSTAPGGAAFTIPAGVVGVYEKTIRLEGPSQWNN